MREPLAKGFMKSGWFSWPTNSYKCIDCEAEVRTTNSGGERCKDCGRKHINKLRRGQRARKKAASVASGM